MQILETLLVLIEQLEQLQFPKQVHHDGLAVCDIEGVPGTCPLAVIHLSHCLAQFFHLLQYVLYHLLKHWVILISHSICDAIQKEVIEMLLILLILPISALQQFIVYVEDTITSLTYRLSSLVLLFRYFREGIHQTLNRLLETLLDKLTDVLSEAGELGPGMTDVAKFYPELLEMLEHLSFV